MLGCEVCPSLQQSHSIKPLRAFSYLPAVGTGGGFTYITEIMRPEMKQVQGFRSCIRAHREDAHRHRTL